VRSLATWKARLLRSRYADRLRGISVHWPELPVSIVSAVRLILHQPAQPCVLLVEPNTYHGETLPSYLHYFSTLGYSCVVLCRLEHLREECFCRVKPAPHALPLDPAVLRWLLTLGILRRYEWLFITSRKVADPHFRLWGRYLGSLKREPQTKRGTACVEHALDSDEHPSLVERDRTMVLFNPPTRPTSVPEISVHHFGLVQQASVRPSARRFVFVGRPSVYREALVQLFRALAGIDAHRAFEIHLVGPTVDAFGGDTVPPCVRFCGRLRFPDLYNLIEASDFVLPLLDPLLPQHADYLGRLISGSRQLILGFQKVPVMDAVFARHYGLPESGVVLYRSGGLHDALVQAINLSDAEYESRRACIAQAASSANQRSIINLRAVLSEAAGSDSQASAANTSSVGLQA
jgi:hypothetical protein